MVTMVRNRNADDLLFRYFCIAIPAASPDNYKWREAHDSTENATALMLVRATQGEA